MLELYAEKLSLLPDADVDAAIAQIAETPRLQHESGFPDFGTLLLAVKERNHPLSHLREVVRRLARNFGETVDETMLENFQTVAGHRIDEDIDRAFLQIMRDEKIHRMPTTGKFLEACGQLRVRRDGTKPE